MLALKTLWIFSKCTVKPYSLLVVHASLASDNSLSFRHNLLGRIQKIAMAIDDKIRDEKIQNDINWETVMNLFKKCTARPYSFLVIDTILAPDNHLRVRYNLSERL